MTLPGQPYPMTYPTPPANRLGVQEAPDYDHVRLIGVEITLRNRHGEQVELEMFTCKHTIPVSQYDYAGANRILVTLHTSAGDVQAEIPLRR